MQKRRLFYFLAIVFLIFLGLSSRKVSGIPEETGDALWAMMVFCLIRLVFIRQKLSCIALASLLVSYAVEFQQMIKWSWLVEFRRTFIGHMLLGQGFLWIDLVAYTIGIVIVFLIFSRVEKVWK